jgi:large subunit ribosomal protein L15
MVNKGKKVDKQRGHRTHGYGSQKKHRGKGSRGGRGLAGSEKHRKTYLLKYKPGHLGKRIFKSKTRKTIRAINIRELASIAGNEKKIDLSGMGYDKVLGKGEIKTPLEVKADYFSKSAREKIEKAGGKAIANIEKVKAEPEDSNANAAEEPGEAEGVPEAAAPEESESPGKA